jgi:PhnB protein
MVRARKETAMAKAVPQGYTTVTPFLSINGCAEAMEFYKKAFGAEELNRAPMPDGRVMHAEMQIGNSRIMFSDPMMGPPTQTGLHLYVEDCDALFDRAVKAGCKVEMPIGDQFWGDRYGVLSDRWGNKWSIATHKEDVAPDEMRRRMEAAMAQMKK